MLQIITVIITAITLIIISGSIAGNSPQAAQAPSSYQGIFEIHEPSVIHGEPSLLESLCLLGSHKMPDHTLEQHSFSLAMHGPGVPKHLEQPDGLGQVGADHFWAIRATTARGWASSTRKGHWVCNVNLDFLMFAPR